MVVVGVWVCVLVWVVVWGGVFLCCVLVVVVSWFCSWCVVVLGCIFLYDCFFVCVCGCMFVCCFVSGCLLSVSLTGVLLFDPLGACCLSY